MTFGVLSVKPPRIPATPGVLVPNQPQHSDWRFHLWDATYLRLRLNQAGEGFAITRDQEIYLWDILRVSKMNDSTSYM